MRKILLLSSAFMGGALLAATAVRADNLPQQNGVVYQTHVGINTLCWCLTKDPAVWYWVPNSETLHGVTVLLSKHDGNSISFHYDVNQVEVCHNSITGNPAVRANDLDDLAQ